LEIRFEDLSHRYLQSRHLTHHALEDAVAQAEIFRGLMNEIAAVRSGNGAALLGR
jgi:hypothetical protein